MQFTTTIIALAFSATTSFAAPSLVQRTYCPSTIDITAYGAADGVNYINSVPVKSDWVAISGAPHPELSISQIKWTSMDIVHCVFQGVDTPHGAGPVLANPVDGRLQVGPPQTLTQAKCWCS